MSETLVSISVRSVMSSLTLQLLGRRVDVGHRVLSILCICHLALCSDEYDTAGFVLSFVWYRQKPAYDGRAYFNVSNTYARLSWRGGR